MLSAEIDAVRLNFSPDSLLLLNLILGVIIYGIALELRVQDFRRVLQMPRAVAVGLVSQFLLLPAITWLLILLIEPQPSLALGMMLVAACPGGSVSNFMTHLAQGNTALSISMTAVSTLAAMVMTPLNLTFWAARYAPTAGLLQIVQVDLFSLLKVILLLLGLPLVAGMFTAARFPEAARRMRTPMRWFSILAFIIFVIAAFAANFDYFLRYIHVIAGLVALHNAMALTLGYGASRILALSKYNARAVAIEVGIQNSALGLALIFDFFPELGGMAIVAGWWGIWHLISGLTVAFFWSRRPVAGGVAYA